MAHIRLAEAKDAAVLSAIYRPCVELSVVSFEVAAPDESEMARRIVETITVYPWLVWEIDGTAVGYAYASKHSARAAYRWSVDTSVYVDPRLHRRGGGRALYTSLFGILRAQGFVNAYAGITLPNAGSVGFHEHMGFRPVGVYERVGFKFGAWHDVGWWQMPLAAHPPSPSEPVSFAELQARHPRIAG